MKKKILAVFLSLCMAMSLVPVGAMAAGEETYPDWTSTTSLPSQGTYKLTQNVTINGQVTVNGTLTLDLNGHTITAANSYAFFVQASGSLEIDDSQGTGKVTNQGASGSSKTVIHVNGGGQFTLSGGCIENTTSNGYAVFVNSGSKALIGGGTVVNTGANGYALYVNGSNGNAADVTFSSGTIQNTSNGGKSVYINGVGEFEMTGGTINQEDTYPSGAAIYVNGASQNILVSGGNVTSNCKGIESASGEILVTGGTFDTKSYTFQTRHLTVDPAEDSDLSVSSEEAIIYSYSSSENTINGGTFVSPYIAKSYTSASSNDSTLDINGGKFSGLTGVEDGNSGDDITIMGGTYTGSDGYINVNEYLGNGVTQNADGSIVANITDNTEATVGNVAYDSLAIAIDDAEAGETVTLLKDVNVANTIDINKDLTIDLNGKMITGVFGDAGRRVFYVQKGILTLTGEGTVTTAARNDNSFANNSSVIRVGNGSSWTEAGTDTAGLVVGADVTVLAPASYGISAFGSNTRETVTISGTVRATGPASAVSGNGQDTQTSTTIEIKDGAEIYAENAVAIYHPQAGTLTIGAAAITGTGGIEAKAGSTTVAVDGAIITATGTPSHNPNSNGPSTTGYAIAAVQNDAYSGNAIIKISDGHFNGSIAMLSDEEQPPTTEEKSDAITISSGHFSDPVDKAYLTDSLTAELYSLNDPTTPYSYYSSVEDAQAAAQPGDVVTDLTTVKEDAEEFTVVFDYGNGTEKELTMREGAKTSLPTLNDRGYNHFVGWSDGKKTYAAGDEVTISKDTTFTAVWNYIPPANPNYKITIGDMENGSVTANPTTAKAGATVTLTATPDEGYAVGTITVTDRFGDAVKVTENADGTYTFTMPNGQVTVKATFVETEEPAPAEPFPDVDENDWFYDEVVYVYENGLMNGVENNQFAPNTATNRAMLATILYRLAGEPAVSGDLPFTDVESGTWYTDAVLWAAQNGIVNGLGENTFAPMNTLTREQLVTMLYRYAEAEGYDVSAAADLSGYPDAGKVQPYAQEAMSWAVAEGIVEGMDGNLNPAGSATRAQIATILMRFCEDVAQ